MLCANSDDQLMTILHQVAHTNGYGEDNMQVSCWNLYTTHLKEG